MLRTIKGECKSGQGAEKWRREGAEVPLSLCKAKITGARRAENQPQLHELTKTSQLYWLWPVSSKSQPLRFLEIWESLPSILDSTIYRQVAEMADPLSVAASLVGLAIPALHGTRLLFDDIQNIVDAPKAVASLKEDLVSVDMAIEALKAVQSSEWELFGQDVINESKFAVSSLHNGV
jgi:hypothetical protein